MPSSRKISPASSQGVNSTRTPSSTQPRRSRSVCSAKSNTSLRLSTLVSDSFKLTPIAHRQSVLNDETDIEIHGRKTWWVKLGENSRDVIDVLENGDIPEVNNIAEEFDVEILSQGKKNYSTDLPESSDGESINSIVIPQRKLFKQKEIQSQKKFGHIIDNRETLAKLQKSHIDEHKAIKIAPKNLFNLASKPRTKPAFPAALLNISSKTVNKTNEMPTAEVNGQVRNLFGNRLGNKRKNMFADFIVSESEDEIPDIQPKLFGFQNNKGQKRRESSASDGIAHASASTIDLEMDDWKLLPSSTMVENQLEEAGTTPVKRAKISKFSEPKETVTSNTNITVNKTKQSIKSKNTSKSNINLSTTSKMNNEFNEENNHTANNSNNFIQSISDKGLVHRESETTNTNSTVNITKLSNKLINSRNKSKNTSKSNINLSSTSKMNNEFNEENNHTANNSNNFIQSISDKGLVHRESETTNTNSTVNITKLSNKLINSRNKSINTSKSNINLNLTSEINNKYNEENNHTANNSNNFRLTRNKSKSIRESSNNENNHSKITNKSKNPLKLIQNIADKGLVQEDHKSQHDIDDDDDEDFTLEYENDDEQVNPTNINKSDKINEKESYNQLIEGDNYDKNTTAIECHIEKVLSEDVLKEKTGNKKETNEKIKTQNDRHEQDNSNNHIEEQVEPNEQQNQSLMKDNENKKENDRRNCDTNQPKDIVKPKKHTLTDDHNDSDHQSEPEKSREVEEGVDTNQSLNNEPNESNGSEHEESIEAEEEEEFNESLNNEENDSNQAEPEESREVEEDVDTNQSLNNEPSENNGSEHEESIEAEEEEELNESLNNEENDSNQAEPEESREVEEDVDTNQSLNNEPSENSVSEHEESIEADEEKESDESLDNEENDSNQTEDEEAEEEIETNQTLNDEQSDNDEAEEEAGESDSETDERNETKNQEVSDDAESDDNQQNESNLSQSENIQEEESMESEQEQSDVDDNEVAGDEIVPDESDDQGTTGRHRKKNETIVKSPEAILHEKLSDMESSTAKGRRTSIRKTKSIIKNLNIRPSLAPVRESTGLTGTRDSSAEGSVWDSHRTTRKTIRLTMGKDFTLRKSLRALVMEKSAKQYIEVNEEEMNADNTKIPLANSTELPAFESYQETEHMHVDETVEEPSDHEVSARTKQTTLELYLQKIKEETIERKRKTEEKVRAYLKAPPKSTFCSFKMPQIPVKRTKASQNKPKPKQTKSSLFPLDMLPPEVLEDMKYKPPKRFQPCNASWITKRLYKYIEDKLEPKYDYKARVRAERFMEMLYEFSREARKVRGPSDHAVDTLKKEMARLNIIKTHFEFYCFFNKFMPREIRIRVVPDVVNKISLPKTGIFSDILQ